MHFLFFFFLWLGHVDILLILATTPVRNSFLTKRLSSKLCWLPHSPPSQPLASTLLAGSMLLRTYHCPHSSVYKLCIGTTDFLFGFLTLEKGNVRLSRNFGKKLPSLAAQQPRRAQFSSTSQGKPEITQFGSNVMKWRSWTVQNVECWHVNHKVHV